MLEVHYMRVARTAAEKERDGSYQQAAYKWRKAGSITNEQAKIDWCKAREAHCWKMSGKVCR